MRMFAKLGLRSTDLLLNTEMHAMLPANVKGIFLKCYRNVIEILDKCHRNILEILDKCHRNIRKILLLLKTEMHAMLPGNVIEI